MKGAPAMTLTEAIDICERMALRKLGLAGAQRGPGARAAGARLGREGTALAMVLAALPEGARR